MLAVVINILGHEKKETVRNSEGYVFCDISIIFQEGEEGKGGENRSFPWL